LLLETILFGLGKNNLVRNVVTDCLSPVLCINMFTADSFYVTWGAHHVSGGKTAPGQPLPPHGKPLGKLTSADLKDVIKKVLWEL
jgi:hypothetical protein